ncbi:hypothetical protein PtA15_11A422 [Puccinia triticina]|uniref:Uncharacterized protein n=1 Tax=Puccinia triticina TaxID=208348 RepID=A0ABY7CWY9_9BASI|nr:uncharacterized protein PtA15_11A422 [Puccinia triticina]WAQ89731.1 hypothetical protein PtA15_11A422 [Puccinia triticina]
MSSSSQSDHEDQSSRRQLQQSRRPDVTPSSRVHSNQRRHNSRRAPYAPPLRGSQASSALASRSVTNGPARPEQLPSSSRREDSPYVERGGTTRTYGGPRGGVGRAWPPTIVPFEIAEAHLSDDFVDDMGRTYDLRAPYTEFGEELIQIPEPRQYAVLLYSILSVRQSVELLIRARDLAGPMSTAASLSVQARLFSYNRHFRTFVQNRAKEILMDPHLEVYSCDPVKGGPPAGRSLLEQTMDHVRIQTDEFKIDYLPAGFLERDPAAEASVNSEL